MSAQWKERREGGGRFGLRLIRGLARHGGRRIARICLYPITAYFLLRRGPERRDSRAYLSRVLGRPAGVWQVARHIHTFAATILDRVFLLSGQLDRFDIRVQGLDALRGYLDSGRGVLLFGSHLGSFEVLRVLSRQRPETPLRVLLDRAHSATVTQVLDALAPDIAATVIDAGRPGTEIMLQIQQAAAQGAMIALLVDRVQPDQPQVRVPFVDGQAGFPLTPWQIAAVLGLPVMLAFGLYRGGNRYDLVFEPFSDGIDLPRGARAAGLPPLIVRYAARLEHHLRDAPYNWFNFYNFWEGDDDARSGTEAAPPRGTVGAGPVSGAAPGAGPAGPGA